MIDFKAKAQAMRGELVARRRDFHMYPELAFDEVRTAGIIVNELTKLGLEVQPGVGKTGVVALLNGDCEGPTVLYRADMDALPIVEENEVDYVSKTPGVMHACGHDGHMAIALGVAKLMSQQRDKIAGCIKFVFQPGEEGAGGALAMIDDGVLEDPVPDISLGLHLWNPLQLGTVGVTKGPVMSASSIFSVIIRGKGGHGAMPHTTIDPVACTGQVVTALHGIVGRKMDAMAGAVVLSVTGIKTSSYAHNIIPAYVEIMGTFRSFNAYTSEMLEQHIRNVCYSVCESVGCTADVRVKHLTIPVINDPDVTGRVHGVFLRMLGEEKLNTEARTMASEDMSYMMEDVPGTFFFVGSSNQARGLGNRHHNPRFDFDEDALPLGVALVSAALAEYLLPEK